MHAHKLNNTDSNYLVFSGLESYLPSWQVIDTKNWGGGSTIRIHHKHIKNGAQVCSIIRTLENFAFRIPFHRECHALLAIDDPGILSTQRIAQVYRNPVLIQDAWEPLSPVQNMSVKERMECLLSIAKTFDRMHAQNYAFRRVSLQDIGRNTDGHLVFQSLGWLATYFPTEPWREILEQHCTETGIRSDLVSFVGLLAELLDVTLASEEGMTILDALQVITSHTYTDPLESAEAIAQWACALLLATTDSHSVSSTEDADWSIDLLLIYHERLSMLCIPEGNYVSESSIVHVPHQTWMSQKPISQSLFSLVLNKPPQKAVGPVRNISWLEAVHFCNRLSRLFKKEEYYICEGAEHVRVNLQANGFRLPFLDEWRLAFLSSRQYMFRDIPAEWMEDRFCPQELPSERIFDAKEKTSIPARWHKRVVCHNQEKQTMELPKKTLPFCGFRVVLHQGVAKQK